MSLDFADYARFYAGSGMTDAEQREDFEVYACFMECLVRYFWREEPAQNSLGISVDNNTLALIGGLESQNLLQTKFNDAASEIAAGKGSL